MCKHYLSSLKSVNLAKLVRTINCGWNTGDQKGSHVMKISIEVTEQRLPQYEASKYLFVLANAAKLEFSGCQYICEGNLVTYLSVTRARVRAMYVSAAYRLSTYLVDRINRRRNPVHLPLSISLQPFSTGQKVFFIRTRSILPRIGLRIWMIVLVL